MRSFLVPCEQILNVFAMESVISLMCMLLNSTFFSTSYPIIRDMVFLCWCWTSVKLKSISSSLSITCKALLLLIILAYLLVSSRLRISWIWYFLIQNLLLSYMASERRSLFRFILLIKLMLVCSGSSSSFSPI